MPRYEADEESLDVPCEMSLLDRVLSVCNYLILLVRTKSVAVPPHPSASPPPSPLGKANDRANTRYSHLIS